SRLDAPSRTEGELETTVRPVRRVHPEDATEAERDDLQPDHLRVPEVDPRRDAQEVRTQGRPLRLRLRVRRPSVATCVNLTPSPVSARVARTRPRRPRRGESPQARRAPPRSPPSPS